MPQRLKPITNRFWAKVDRRADDECWLWLGTIGNDGYGQLSNGRRKYLRAHRLSWELANGRTAPAGMVVCHSCDNPPCVNPAHLWLGTQRENTHDADCKGRRMRAGATLTHCKRGHARSAENTVITSAGTKACRLCRNLASAASRQRRAAA